MNLTVNAEIDDTDIIEELESNYTLSQLISDWPNESEKDDYYNEVYETASENYLESTSIEDFIEYKTGDLEFALDDISHIIESNSCLDEFLDNCDRSSIANWLMGNKS